MRVCSDPAADRGAGILVNYSIRNGAVFAVFDSSARGCSRLVHFVQVELEERLRSPPKLALQRRARPLLHL